jgi:hypothetical protein
MTTLKTTKAYKTKLRTMRKSHGLGNVPTMNFHLEDGTLHSLFIPPVGLMEYLVSNEEGIIEEFTVTNAMLNRGEYKNRMKVVINSPFSNLWIFLQLESPTNQTVFFAGEDFIRKFKSTFSYNNHPEDITSVLHNYLKHS